MDVVAVDVGFGRVKALSAERQLEFPSVVGPWQEIRYKSEVANSGFMDRLAVEYAGHRFFLGDMAYRQSKVRKSMSMDRFCSVEGMALMLTPVVMLLNSKRDVTCHLVTGLPVNVYAAQKDRYTQTLLGRHQIKLLDGNETYAERHITIAQCKVLPQPMGTVFNLVLDDAGRLAHKELASSRLAILDIGANTVDLCRVDLMEFIDRESTSFSDLGVFECYRQMSSEIYNLYEIEIPPEEIEPYVMNNTDRIGAQSCNIADLKRKIYRDAAVKIVSRVSNVWRNLWQFDKIFVTGGGAIAFGEQIAQVFNRPEQVELCKQSTFSNTLGYLKFANRTWRK